MKRNLLSVLILALLIVNVALTAVMMVSVTQTNKKTAALIDSINHKYKYHIVTLEDPVEYIYKPDL